MKSALISKGVNTMQRKSRPYSDSQKKFNKKMMKKSIVNNNEKKNSAQSGFA